LIKFKVYRKILLVGRYLGEDLQQKLKRRARGLQIHMPISAKKIAGGFVMVIMFKLVPSRHFSLIIEEGFGLGVHTGYSVLSDSYILSILKPSYLFSRCTILLCLV
jgi:hypothetical protein